MYCSPTVRVGIRGAQEEHGNGERVARDHQVLGGRRGDRLGVETGLALAAADVEREEVAREAARGARVAEAAEREREQVARARVADVRREIVNLAARRVHRHHRRHLLVQRRHCHPLQQRDARRLRTCSPACRYNLKPPNDQRAEFTS